MKATDLPKKQHEEAKALSGSQKLGQDGLRSLGAQLEEG